MDSKKLIKSIGQIPIVRGDNRGKVVGDVIQPFQVQFLKAFCKPTKANYVFSCGRGNGKSAMLAWLSIAFLNSEMYPHFENDDLVVLSSSVGAFSPVAKLIRLTMKAMQMKQGFRIIDNDQRFRITNKASDCDLRLIPSSVAAQHGLIGKWVLCDEFSQFKRPDYVVAALDTGGGKEPESKLVFFGTLPRDDAHPMNQLIIEKGADFSGHVRRASNDDLTWKNINRANPVLKVLPSLKIKIKNELAKAKKSDRAKASFVALRLNRGGHEVAISLLCSSDEWKNILAVQVPTDTFKSMPIWGLDLSTVKSMSVLTNAQMDDKKLITIENLATFGNAIEIKKREELDSAIGIYQEAVQRGDLFVSSTRSANIKELLEAGVKRFGRPALITCDRFKFHELYDICQEIDALKGVPFAPTGMGFKDGGKQLRAWEEIITNRRLAVVNPWLITYSLQFATVAEDLSGNKKLVRHKETATTNYAKNDVVASSLLAIFKCATTKPQYPMTAERMKLLHSPL